MKSIEPPWLAIKERIPEDEPDLDWFNCPRNPSNPDPDSIDQRPTWQPEEIQLDDGRVLVLEFFEKAVRQSARKLLPKEFLAKRIRKLRLRKMRSALKTPTSARSRRAAEHSSFQTFNFQRFSFTETPLVPRPPVGSIGFFSSLPPKANS